MSGTLNKVILVGRLGQDPELAYLPSGDPKCTFSLATDESYVGRDGQKVEKTEWHRIVAWRKQAEFVGNYLSKGRLVLVEGRLETRKWQDQQGQNRYMTEIVAQRVQAMDAKGQRTEDAPSMTEERIDSGQDPQPSETSDMDKLPF
ncbi:MAG TPA: single-stranded DNA-binding protein [Desulfonatronum sp.]|nr:single-stranded DNA-binding protein [Desulfonatronum sp.]